MKCPICHEDQCQQVEGDEETRIITGLPSPYDLRHPPGVPFYRLYQCASCGPYGLKKSSLNYLSNLLSAQRGHVTRCVRDQPRLEETAGYFMIEWKWLVDQIKSCGDS